MARGTDDDFIRHLRSLTTGTLQGMTPSRIDFVPQSCSAAFTLQCKAPVVKSPSRLFRSQVSLAENRFKQRNQVDRDAVSSGQPRQPIA
jgi:hypothetical protein